jgi:hypothetical protein
MLTAARLIGLLIVAQGILGLAYPDLFFRLVQAFQVPPVIYLAAVVRVVFGVVLFLVAGAARASIGLRILGGLIAVWGALSPF